jgi:hypothetical protein
MFKDKAFLRKLAIILMIGLSVLSIVATMRYALKASPMIKVFALIVDAIVFYFTYSLIKKKNNGE